MRLLLSGVIALVALCRLAAAGEGVTLPVDSTSFITRLVADFGGLGVCIAILLYDRREERKKRAEVDQRWHVLDGKLLELVDKCAAIIAECIAIMAEVRKSLRDHDRKISDVVKQSPTCRIQRHETDTE